MKHYLFAATFFLLLFSSCADADLPIITYDIEKTDYQDFIEATGSVRAVTTTSITAPRSSGLKIIWLAEEGTIVKEGDTLCLLKSVPLEENLESQIAALEVMRNELATTELSIEDALFLMERNIDNNKLDMSQTKLDSVKRQFLPALQQQVLDLKFKQAIIKRDKLQKQFAAQKTISASNLQRRRSNITRLESQIKSTQTQLDRLSVLAPRPGVVLRVERRGSMQMSTVTVSRSGGTDIRTMSSEVFDSQPITEGTDLVSGEQILTIPDLTEVQIRIMVPEIDYKRIETGQKARIRVESVKDLETTGIVEKKTLASSMSSARSRYRSGSSSEKKYEIILKVDSLHLQMKPGLSARCQILINVVKDTIVVPSVAVFIRDSTKIVYVAEGNLFRPVPVETGLSNSSSIIISKGLKVGQTIALMEPQHQKLIKVKLKPNIKAGSSDSVTSVKDSVIKM